MRALAKSVCALWFLACASAKPLPPGDELEEAPSASRTAAPADVPPPLASADELEAAFESSKPPPTPAPAPSPAVVEAPPAQKPATVPSVDGGALLSKTRGALNRGDLEAAAQSLNALNAEAANLSARDALLAAELGFKLALARKDPKEARSAAELWLNACGPEQVERCRGQAVAALETAAKQPGADVAKLKQRVALIRKSDACVRRTEMRGGHSTPTCLEAALGAYRKSGDRLMLARALLARGLRLATEASRGDDALTRVTQAETACEEKRCTGVRRRALKAIAQLHLRKSDVEKAASALLKEMELAALTLPEHARMYARTPDVEKVCLRLDEAQSEGSCRKLELQLLGHYTFRDYSRGRAAGQGLSTAQVKAVNEHYGVTLRSCLEAEAATLKPPASVTYRVQWTVTNDGRVDAARLEKKDKDDGPFGSCLRDAFKVWRYPQYRGELQHVEQAFVLQARERRSSLPPRAVRTTAASGAPAAP